MLVVFLIFQLASHAHHAFAGSREDHHQRALYGAAATDRSVLDSQAAKERLTQPRRQSELLAKHACEQSGYCSLGKTRPYVGEVRTSESRTC